MSTKENLDTARKKKQDEFYTQLSDIQSEVVKYSHLFSNQSICLPCNDYKRNFHRYFHQNFTSLNLKELIAISYDKSCFSRTYHSSTGVKTETQPLSSGDFSSSPVRELITQSDIILTNPPFSLFDDFLLSLVSLSKKFLILGPFLSSGHKEIFPLIQNNILWWGTYLSFIEFQTPPDYPPMKVRYREDSIGRKFRSFGNITWFTNLSSPDRETPLTLTETYSPSLYPTYDNYPAIEVTRVPLIPKDYFGEMGVPITFLSKYCPLQFQITGFRKGKDGKDLTLSGKNMFSRILIKRVIL